MPWNPSKRNAPLKVDSFVKMLMNTPEQRCLHNTEMKQLFIAIANSTTNYTQWQHSTPSSVPKPSKTCTRRRRRPRMRDASALVPRQTRTPFSGVNRTFLTLIIQTTSPAVFLPNDDASSQQSARYNDNDGDFPEKVFSIPASRAVEILTRNHRNRFLSPTNALFCCSADSLASYTYIHGRDGGR